jgi:hypothetical protein
MPLPINTTPMTKKSNLKKIAVICESQARD